jgi:hypothetical protein
MSIEFLLSKIGVSQNMLQDATLLVVIVFVSFIFGIFIGRYKLITVLINIYVSLAILAVVPEGYLKNYNYDLIFFFVSLIILTLISKRLFEIYISGSGSGFLWRVFVMSFLEVVFLLSIVVSMIPKSEAMKYVSQNLYFYLASPNAKFIWMIIPLAFIFLIHKRINR